jgi:DHA2 family multidrug resistance protein-like MFS transporter
LEVSQLVRGQVIRPGIGLPPWIAANARAVIVRVVTSSIEHSSPGSTLSASDRRALIAILLAVALGSLDTAIANTALPAIAADLQATPAASIWIINAYQMAIVATLLPFASLGDLWGSRKVFLGGLAFFTVSSLGCALSDSLVTLTLARVLQGVGASAIMSVNIALIRLIYPAHRLGRGVGLNALVVGVGFACGPTVASLVLSVASWPWLFAINVPLGVLCFAFGRPTLPRSEPRAHGFDPVTALLTGITFSALVLALGLATHRDDARWLGLSLLTAGVVCALLLRRQAGHSAPMLPVDLFRRPLFALSAATALCAFATQGLALVSLPFYFEQVLHRDPIQTGFLMTPWAVVVAAIAPVAGRLSDRHAPGLLGGIGLGALAVGMASLALLPAQPGVPDIVVRMVLCGMGFGFFQSPNLRALMASAPPERAGGASGVIAMARLLGQATGAALVALCFGLAGTQGAVWALWLGMGTAALGAAASTARLWAR